MQNSLSFGVDPNLATVLGSSYRSTEQAIKELVDNAWDADAGVVRIVLPEKMTSDPVTVTDDGVGMTSLEVREEYMKVARDRRSVKGERTRGKNRRVKGRKGVGKFAGLMVAERMELATRARGIQSTLIIERAHLLQAKSDFEKVQLPFFQTECPKNEHGTTVVLSDLNRRLLHPSPEKLRGLLLAEYGRSLDFTIIVNDVPTTLKDVPGEIYEHSESLPSAGAVSLGFAIADAKNGVR